MRKLILALAVTALPFHALADDPASKAKNWNLNGEVKVLVSGKIVDIKCELTGDCADECGAGSMQLGILTSDGNLIPVMKNGQTSFNGAVVDLLPHCGKSVDADGLMVGEDVPAQLYQVQLLKAEGGEWAKANLHTKAWKKQFPDAGGKGPWFRRDPRVLSQLAQDGYLGLGEAEDKKFISENY